MRVIITVDNNLGMMFNNRRQSKDKNLRNFMLFATKDSRLLMNEYTRKQFEEDEKITKHIVVDNDCLQNATKKDYVFVENMDIAPYIDKIDELIVFYWNRVYPSDMKLSINLNEWENNECIDFVGNSHELISMKVYRKKEEKEEENV